MPAMMEGTHRNAKLEYPRPYVAYTLVGAALMFDARLIIQHPKSGGGVVFAILFDMNPESSPNSLYVY